MKALIFFLLLSSVIYGCGKNRSTEPASRDISNLDWYIWPDRDALWIDDTLHLPPVSIDDLPVNEPTCGWDVLYGREDQKTTLPATVEEYFWNKNGNQYGISGNYKGVSWFFTSLNIPQSLKGKRLFLDFESVRMRAEVFVNNQLAGYDLIDGTPFSVDIGNYVKFGKMNRIAVRITDPNGNFNWRDSRKFKWGRYITISSHGFGGITGKVFLRSADSVYIDDIYVKNKPEVTGVDVEVQLDNSSINKENGQMVYEIYEKQNLKNMVYRGEQKMIAEKGRNQVFFSIDLKNAKIWSPEEPNLYTLKVRWEGENTHDLLDKTFGFRWFDIVVKGDDRYFVLNNKRIVLRTSISWGFWPVNGIFPIQRLAEKHISDAKKLGLNMLNFHRAIGCNMVLGEADRQGLLYYEEPGGYRTGTDDFSGKWAQIKLLRMIKRDRSHPSLIIYNMQNEIGRDPTPFDIETIKKAHKLDEARFITYTSTNFGRNLYDGKCPVDSAGIKMNMVPYSHDVQYYGYWDQHHAGGPGCYYDGLYNSPEDYLRYTSNSKEIVFYGEEGAIGTPPQLPLIVKEINSSGKQGWDGVHFINMYDGYDYFLKNKGFYSFFPDMESLITSMGNVALYYQGRIIENIRANNLVDGYVVNGWESEKIENHSGIVDEYRNIKGNPEILAYYNQPVYIAVKARNKVIETGDTSLVDFYIINETNIRGTYSLQVTCTDSSGVLNEATYPVDISGGTEYGQLLTDGFRVIPHSPGYCQITARLVRNDVVAATGRDEIFCVGIEPFVGDQSIAYSDDSTNTVRKMLSSTGINNCKQSSEDDVPQGSILVTGWDPPEKISRNQNALFDWIMDGNTLIIIKNAEKWAHYLNQKEVIDYRGYVVIGNVWFGGNYFVKDHPLFKDLPVNCAFNWEYQSLALYKRHRIGMRLEGEECVVGVQCEHKPELFTAVGIIPVGRGKIILSSLDLEGAILSGDKSSVVAKKILMNYIEYGLKNEKDF